MCCSIWLKSSDKDVTNDKIYLFSLLSHLAFASYIGGALKQFRIRLTERCTLNYSYLWFIIQGCVWKNHLLGDFLEMPFFVEFKIEPSRLKLDWRTIFMEFFGGNGGGDGSLSCSIGLCLPQRPIIIFKFEFEPKKRKKKNMHNHHWSSFLCDRMKIAKAVRSAIFFIE